MAANLSNLPPEAQLRRLLLRDELVRLDQLQERVGDDAALKASVVPIIADVLQDAGVRDYQRLAGALAPLIVAGMKAEIRNSRDMMVDALYPITGRLVAAAVRNAFTDLVQQLNEKLEASLSAQRWQAWLKARLTGRSEAEILLGAGAAFEVIDLLLIDRHSGLLLARARPGDPAQDDLDGQLLSGILAAIMLFVRDAMKGAREQELRTLEVGDVCLHLQVSPSTILAVKTKGPQPARFASALAALFTDFLAGWGGRLQAHEQLGAADRMALGDDLAGWLQALLQAQKRNFKRPSRLGTVLLALLLAGLLGWIGWSGYQRWQTSRVEAAAAAVIGAQPALQGYPIEVRYDSAERRLAVSGLAPDRRTIEALERELAAALPDVSRALALVALPQSGAAGLADRLTSLAADLERQRAEAERQLSALQASQADLLRANQAQSARLDELRQDLDRERSARAAALADGLAGQQSALQAGLADMGQAASARVAALRQSLDALQATLAGLDARLPEDALLAELRFERWLRANPIRFGSGASLAEPAAAQRTLAALMIRLAQAPAASRLLIIGYADDTGDAGLNQTVSIERAAAVAARLRALGAEPARLVIAGRGREGAISDVRGAASPNRRVEFALLPGR